jgi:flagellar secretion chaperone FliS
MSPYSQNSVNAYKAVSGMVSKTRQVVMLYDGVIRLVQQAKQAIADNNIQERYNCLSRACEVINGLQYSLDMKNGGEVAQLLYDYYAGLDMRLLSVHQSNDATMLDISIRHLKMMRDAWEEIDQKYGNTESSDTSVEYRPEIKEALERTQDVVMPMPSPDDLAKGLSVSHTIQ